MQYYLRSQSESLNKNTVDIVGQNEYSNSIATQFVPTGQFEEKLGEISAGVDEL